MWWRALCRTSAAWSIGFAAASTKLGQLNGLASWGTVAGPAAATVRTLLETGWQPMQPDRWANRSGSLQARIGIAWEHHGILAAFRSDTAVALWNRASNHFGGE